MKTIKRWGIRFLLLSIVLLVILAGLTEVQNSPKTCGICHIMKPQIMTWQASAHSKITCVTCHVEWGLQNTLEHDVEIMSRIYMVATQQYLLPVEIKHPVRNEVCLECHTFMREITPLNDIKVPHEKHLKVGVNCVECHEGIVHATLAERNMTIDGNFEQWTPEFGAAQVLPENMRIGMKDCLKCHSLLHKGPGPSQCQVCHQKMMTPQSHRNQQDWLNKHGLEALKDIAKCDKCHNYTNVDSVNKTLDRSDITQYTRNNTFCSGCHSSRRPPKHTASWTVIDHRQTPQANVQYCLVCHNLDEPKPWEKVAKTFCGKCHSANLGTAFFMDSSDKVVELSKKPIGYSKAPGTKKAK